MEELVPSNFLLSQNFPNPFKEITKIKYCLPLKINVRLTVFNDDGEIVKVLVNKIQKAGTYEVKYVSRDLPDGIYSYQLLADNPESSLPAGQKCSSRIFVDTKKMILQK